MISTPLSLLLNKMPPPQAGGASQSPAADVTVARDFADLMSRLFYSNMPVAAIARAAEIPDAMVPLPDAERIEPERRPDAADDANRRDRMRPEDSDNAAAPERRADAFPEPLPMVVSGEPSLQKGEPAPTALPVMQQPPSSSAVPPPGSQGADRAAMQNAPSLVQAKDADAPQAAPQQGRHAQTGNGDFPRVQLLDGGAKDQPPPLGHMLSGRTAVAAQSDDGVAQSLKDAAIAPKGGAAEQTASALFGGAAQATSAAAQKAKGQSRTAAPGGGAQITGGAQATPTSAAQPQQAVATTQATTQSGFDGALAAASGGSGQAGTLAAPASRNEPLPLVGNNGQQAPQAAFRAPESAAAPKPRIPVPPRFIADQVAVQIQKSLGQGNDRISIQLKPAELGKVEVRLDVGHEGRVTAVITADRADTLELLQRDARLLQHSLQDAGLRADSNSLSFELRSQGQAFDNGHNGHGTGNMSGSAGTGADDGISLDRATPLARPEIVTNDRVDIHV